MHANKFRCSGCHKLYSHVALLKVGDEVYVMDSSSDIWYGLCGENCGYFDSRLVRLVKVDNKHVSSYKTQCMTLSQNKISWKVYISVLFRG